MMSGNAFIYYGEELGMKGSGKDENKRAPMYFSSDPSAEGMCRGPSDMDDFEMKFGSYEEQKDDPSSVYQKGSLLPESVSGDPEGNSK